MSPILKKIASFLYWLTLVKLKFLWDIWITKFLIYNTDWKNVVSEENIAFLTSFHYFLLKKVALKLLGVNYSAIFHMRLAKSFFQIMVFLINQFYVHTVNIYKNKVKFQLHSYNVTFNVLTFLLFFLVISTLKWIALQFSNLPPCSESKSRFIKELKIYY